MRTTLDLPRELVEEALAVTQIKTKTALITTALQELVRRHAIADIKKYRGKIDFDVNLDQLRDRT